MILTLIHSQLQCQIMPLLCTTLFVSWRHVVNWMNTALQDLVSFMNMSLCVKDCKHVWSSSTLSKLNLRRHKRVSHRSCNAMISLSTNCRAFLWLWMLKFNRSRRPSSVTQENEVYSICTLDSSDRYIFIFIVQIRCDAFRCLRWHVLSICIIR